MDTNHDPDSPMSRFIDKFLQHETIHCTDTPLNDQFDSYHHTPISSYHHRCFIKICKNYKIPITKQRQPYIWDGKQLDITQLPTFNSQMHEVGHYLVCPLEYKHHIDYGLGPGGAYDIETYRDDVDEDVLASVFGLYLEFLIGDDIAVTIGNIGVDDVLPRKFLIQCFQHYYDLGIVNKHGFPCNSRKSL